MRHRSWLFVPGDSARKLEKAADSGAGALILDLEDAVAADAKPAARHLVAQALARPTKAARFVRVNGLDTDLTEVDVAATVRQGPDGYVLPKCEGREDIEALSGLIVRHGGGDGIRILAIATETARGLRRLMREDWSHPRLCALAWGAEDLSADLGTARSRDAAGRYLGPFRLARDVTLLAAAEAGVDAVDAVYTDFTDAEGLGREASDAHALGFAGKMAIHPGQLDVIAKAFRPDPEQVAWAQSVLRAISAAGSGTASLNGQMLDRPHVLKARKILQEAAQGGQSGGPE